MLIIWDFDGVICDSEHIWTECWQKLLWQEKNIKLSAEEAQNLLVGVADKDKKIRIEQYFSGLVIDDIFMDKIQQLYDYGMKNLLTLTPGVEEIFRDSRFKQCIATGGTKYQTKTKNHSVGIDKYFDERNCFTADMVANGKPAPDLFLLAAKTMQTPIDECVVIEDAVSGITAAKAAGMKCYAFVGASDNNTPEYKQKCLAWGADETYDNMTDLYNALKKLSADK